MTTPTNLKKLRASSRLCRCGIFNLECGHGENRRTVLSSSFLGAAKSLTTVSSSQIHSQARRSHAEFFGDAANAKTNQSRKRGWSSLTARSEAQKKNATNGFVIYRTEKQHTSQHASRPARHRSIKNRTFQFETVQAWHRLPEGRKQQYRALAKQKNQNICLVYETI
jgi:hypothetical protein